MKKIRVHGPNLQSIKTFSLLNKVSIAGVVAVFSKRACCCQQRLPQTRKYAVFVLARPTSISSARALPQKLSHWFCSQNIQCPVEKPAGVIATPICHMTWVTMINRGSGLDSNLNSASWLMSCKDFSAWINYVVFEFFSDQLKMPKLRQVKQLFQSSSPRLEMIVIYSMYCCSNCTSIQYCTTMLFAVCQLNWR